MNLQAYRDLFKAILNGEFVQAPYDSESYINYVKLNHSRMKRWTKQGVLTPALKEAIEAIKTPQTWVLITEPWCGDAANSVPYLEKMAALNPNITVEVQLRDSGSEIDQYLTNGGKSIPKLIARDQAGNDLFTWGPRPSEAQALVQQQKTSDAKAEDKYAELLLWYKEDKGISIQEELIQLLTAIPAV
ncbi:thioredoxin family protein [Aureispira anguillae]|uniref:Thioredoxin family protein n=1 Tax=Aureispira anguillae TaxID=2864201 RepID=A0A916DTJ7_9BACT|nr:thioredoxin family protein [Aureispira anguillae]BDS11905.1 thioredoxin family protein [Aureispira anguillae]